jgi:hypothetical protein
MSPKPDPPFYRDTATAFDVADKRSRRASMNGNNHALNYLKQYLAIII